MIETFKVYEAQFERWFHQLSSLVTPPTRIPTRDHFVFRFVDKSIEQALILKLARMVSALRAARALCEIGHYQEQAALQRMIEEYQEDINFLSMALIDPPVTDLHREYLQLLFDDDDLNLEDDDLDIKKGRTIRRKRIHSFIAEHEARFAAGDRSRGAALRAHLSKAYSGYIHAAHPQTMEMFGGLPPHFHVAGMLGTPNAPIYTTDLWNYFYRGAIALSEVALALEVLEVANEVMSYTEIMQSHAGKSYK